jgi:chorismate mutase/prephenate dehydratase
MSASIALQKEVSIAYLGPPGTFSHQAAYNRFGDSVAYVPQKQIDAVFQAVETGQTTYGLVPYENSTFGSVVETLDYLVHTSVRVRAETYLTVHQSLLSNSKLEDITKVYSHPQVRNKRVFLGGRVKSKIKVGHWSNPRLAIITSSKCTSYHCQIHSRGR